MKTLTKKFRLLLAGLLLLSACVGKTPQPEPTEPPVGKFEPLQAVSWAELPGWQDDRLAAGFSAFLESCQVVARRPQWQQACAAARQLTPLTEQRIRQYFQSWFQPYQVVNEDGSRTGLITGYYGPEIAGSRTRTDKFRYPLYRQPDDLLTIDLASVYPELGKYRLRGRLEGNRVVPYFERREIDRSKSPLSGQELFWVRDPVDLFFLHIQGSGRIRLPDGEAVMVGYANQNGHPYHSIGKLLIDSGAMTRDQMSMQNIRRWVLSHPQQGQQLLDENPSYVFFRALSPEYQTPPGALGIPLTPERSLAVDPRTIPLGAPVFIKTTVPGQSRSLQRLMVAQDTGGAIKGRVRADFFWGMGDKAGETAGRMKQEGCLWVLLPQAAAADRQQLQSRVQPVGNEQESQH